MRGEMDMKKVFAITAGILIAVGVIVGVIAILNKRQHPSILKAKKAIRECCQSVRKTEG